MSIYEHPSGNAAIDLADVWRVTKNAPGGAALISFYAGPFDGGGLVLDYADETERDAEFASIIANVAGSWYVHPIGNAATCTDAVTTVVKSDDGGALLSLNGATQGYGTSAERDAAYTEIVAALKGRA